MTRVILVALVLLVPVACADSHRLDGDAEAGVVIDAPVVDGALPSVDGGAARPDAGFSSMGAVCGPNRCRTDEICCNPACGVCAFPGECVDFGCPGGP